MARNECAGRWRQRSLSARHRIRSTPHLLKPNAHIPCYQSLRWLLSVVQSGPYIITSNTLPGVGNTFGCCVGERSGNLPKRRCNDMFSGYILFIHLLSLRAWAHFIIIKLIMENVDLLRTISAIVNTPSRNSGHMHIGKENLHKI